MVPAPVKKSGGNNELNKPMTVDEKNQLGNDIRSLSKDQLKGIIRILKESDSYPKTKYFEFDIDQLSNKKLRELEKYVKECINTNNKNNKQINQITNKIHNPKENINNINKNTSNITNNLPQQNQLSNLKEKEVMKTQQEKLENKSEKKQRQSSNKKEKQVSITSDSISSDSSLSN